LWQVAIVASNAANTTLSRCGEHQQTFEHSSESETTFPLTCLDEKRNAVKQIGDVTNGMVKWRMEDGVDGIEDSIEDGPVSPDLRCSKLQ